MPEKRKIVVILGPTASGKSDFGVALARQFKGEIISADSRQVYRGMDIGTGKITAKEMRGVPHWLLDVAVPRTKTYNCAKFQKDALRKIQEIDERGKLPILVGGTGFWIDSVALNKIFPDVAPNLKLRAQLIQQTNSRLFEKLKKLDPQRAAVIDKHNQVRLIRALEIALSKKKVTAPKKKFQVEALLIGLDLPTEKLYARIESRLDKRLRGGLIAEVARLHDEGLSWVKLEDFGLEYRYVAQYLQGKISREKMRDLLLFAIKHYAKRQRTWFKRNLGTIWLDPDDNAALKKAAKEIKKFLSPSIQ